MTKREKELKLAIEYSGHNLHIKTFQILKDNWETDLSPHYCDDITNKPREIDIRAKKRVEVKDSGRATIYNFNINLFIECKRFNSEILFINFDANDKNIFEALLLDNPFDYITKPSTKEVKKEGLLKRGFEKKHHHLALNKISKFYIVGKQGRKRGEDHNRDMMDAITEPIKSYIFFKEQLTNSVSYLITVFDGIEGIYDVKAEDYNPEMDLSKLTTKKRLFFDINYSYKIPEIYKPQIVKKDYMEAMLFGQEPNYHTQHFIIDFVRLDEFENYLKETINIEEKQFESAIRNIAFYDQKKI